MRFNVGRRPDPIIDVTPMIDVVFQLVLFFMVTTTFVSSNPGIEVDLPRSSAEVVLSDTKDVNVWMTAEGAVYVDEVAVDTGRLISLLRARAEADPNTQVVIKADAGVSHGRVVAVMDLARNQGLTRLAIATEVAADE